MVMAPLKEYNNMNYREVWTVALYFFYMKMNYDLIF